MQGAGRCIYFKERTAHINEIMLALRRSYKCHMVLKCLNPKE